MIVYYLLSKPLCVVVRDQSSIGAFADFKASDAGGEPAPAAAAPAAPAPAPAAQAPPPPVSQAPPPPPPPPAPKPVQAAPAAQPSSQGGRVFATPLARKLAAERNIDLSVSLNIFTFKVFLLY